MRISTRLILLLVTAVLSVMSVYALVTISRTRDRLTEEMRKMGEHVALALSVGALHHLEVGDMEGVRDVLARISHSQEVAGAAVFDSDGDLVAASPSITGELSGERQVYPHGEGKGWFEGKEGHRVYTYVTGIQDRGGQVRWSLRLALHERSMLPYVLEARNTILITIGALAAILSALVIYVSRRQIARPLQALTEGAEAIGRGELDRRIEVEGEGEVGALAAAFNRMAASLEATNRQIIAEREHIRSIVDSIPEGVLVLDREGRIAAWNQTMTTRYGLGLEAVLGKRLVEVFPDIGSSDLRASVERLLAGEGAGFEGEMALDAAPGRVLMALGSRLHDAGVGSGGAVVVLADITERARLERQVQQSEKLAAVGQLAAGIAHEIGTPLNVISGSAEYLLMEMREGDARREELRTIVSEAGRITDLVRRLLAFARPGETLVGDVDVAELIESVLALPRKQMEKQGVEVGVDLEPGLPEVAGDRGQLQQVLMNLVMNAWQAMPGGGKLALTGRRRAPDGGDGGEAGWVELAVADTGQGIPKANLGRIFDPFFTTKDTGTGLGLAIVHRIVEDHGGRVSVASQEGAGTRFAVLLPARASQADRAADGRGDDDG